MEMGFLQSGHGLDKDGYIVSDVSAENISDTYDLCIRNSVEQISKEFPNQIHSVYVYGSVARGDAITIKSDLDLLALFHSPLSAEEKVMVKELSNRLSKEYTFLVRDVGIATANYDHVMDSINYYEQAFLKELCVCVYGEDLRKIFGPYKLTSEIAISFNGDISEFLNRTTIRVESANTEELKKLSQNIARKFIRTYYSMVMARSQIWTTRLNEQADVFIYYFHNKKPIVRTLQQWIEGPPTSRQPVDKMLTSEGRWLVDNFKREAQITSET